jgi:feruloyl-CoA synthase
MVFDGRVAEDCKLSSGTWVHVGTLRVKAISAAAPLIMDCVVAGHDRDEIGLLMFPNAAACAALAGNAALPEIACHTEVLHALEKGLRAYNKDNSASSTRIARALILDSMPSIDANEITDKGYINQRAVLDARADDVARLFAEQPDAGVIVL